MVVPIRRDALSRSDDEVFLAATDFGLFDGSRHVGYCFPADDSGIDYLQPSIVVPGGQVAFWTEGPASPAELAERWRVLGREPGQIFPASFRCRIPVDGGIVSGWIAGIESSRDLTVAIRELAPASGGRRPRRSPTLERAPMARPVEPRAGQSGRRARPAHRAAAQGRTSKVEFTQGAVHGTGVAENVSRRGLFVRTARAPRLGSAAAADGQPARRTQARSDRPRRARGGPVGDGLRPPPHGGLAELRRAVPADEARLTGRAAARAASRLARSRPTGPGDLRSAAP